MKNLIPRFILEKNKENKFTGNFKATTMFIDISGFTAMTQTLMKNGKEGAEILSEIINEIYTPSIQAVYDHNGFVTTFAGDAFTSVFLYKNSKPFYAIDSVQQIQDIFNKIGKQKTKFGDFELSMKIGLSYGTVNWGIIKSDKLNSYYFKGKVVDNCAVSEHSAEKGEIIFDEAVLQKIQNKVTFEKKSNNHFLLKSGLKTDKQKLHRKSSKQLPPTDFIPEQILKLKSKGEFRDIVSCFISFKANRTWKQSVSKILNLSSIYGGYFNKIDFGDKGGNILVLFGAPVGKEKIYSRACGFAQAVKNISGFNTRIGLTYGTAFSGFVGSKLREEYTALGMVVNLSARFMMKASFSEIYIDKNINRHINRRYESNALIKQKFKGFQEKIPVFVLKNKIEYKSVYEGKLIGRQKELQKLKKTLKPIQNGKFGGIVYVHGIAGIGKSRLVNELKQQVEKSKKQKYNWFYMPCDEILRNSFNPFVRFLKDYFDQSEENTKQINKSNFENKLENILKRTKDKEIKNELIRTKSILGAMINLHWENSLNEQLDAKGRFENMLYALKNLIKAESLQKPVIFELEDGHWIDSDSKKLLEVLTRNIEKYPIIIISSCRLKDDESQFNFELKEVTQKNIILEYLEKESSRKMIESKLTGKVSDEVFKLIYQKSEGNPFYIEQIILYLQENELIDDKLKLIRKDFEIPKTINSIIIARIDRLTTELKELVQTASVLGREFAVNILSVMLNRKQINEELTKGENENIWDALTQISYIFKHALIRETVYEMQLKKQLRKLHKLAAMTIEAMYKNDLKEFYGELANHYEKAEIIDQTIEYLNKAGNFAQENYENEQALKFYNRLIENLQDKQSLEGLRIDTLFNKGEILELIGKWEEAEESFKIALQVSQKTEDKNRIAKSYGFLSGHFRLKSNYSLAFEFIIKQIDIYTKHYDNMCLSKALLDKGSIHMNMGNYNKALACFNDAQKNNNNNNEYDNVNASINGNIGIVYMQQGNFTKAEEYFMVAMTINKKIRNKQGIAFILSNMGGINYRQGNFSKAIECSKKALGIFIEIGDKNGVAMISGNIGNVYAAQGDLVKAKEYLEKRLEVSEELGDKRGISIALGNIGEIYRIKGNFKKALVCYEKSLMINEKLNNQSGISSALGYIGSIFLTIGNYDKAIENFEEQITILKQLRENFNLSNAYMYIGVVYSQQSRSNKAIELFDKALEISNKIGDHSFLPYLLFNKSECLYKIQEYNKAKECNQKCYNAAKEMEDKGHILSSNILKEKINFKLSDDPGIKQKSMNNLKNMLQTEKEEEDIAELNYELAIMSDELKIDSSEYKKSAIEIYKKLYEKTPNIEYKNKIEELDKLR